MTGDVRTEAVTEISFLRSVIRSGEQLNPADDIRLDDLIRRLRAEAASQDTDDHERGDHELWPGEGD